MTRLTDLEVDVLCLLENTSGFEGAWRLATKPSTEAQAEVAVAVRGETPWHVHLVSLGDLPAADHRRVWVFDPAERAAPVHGASPIALTDTDRARGRKLAEARTRTPQVEEVESSPRPTRAILVVDGTGAAHDALLPRVSDATQVVHASSIDEATQKWWWRIRRTPDVFVIDLSVPGAWRFMRGIVHQRRFRGRIFLIGDGRRRAGFPLVSTIRAPLAADDVERIVAAAERPFIAKANDHDDHQPRILVVDEAGRLSGDVRNALPDADVVVACNHWDATDLVERRKYDWVICNTATNPETTSLLSLYKMLVTLRPYLRRRVLFATDHETKAQLDRARPGSADLFFEMPFSAEALRARLSMEPKPERGSELL